MRIQVGHPSKRLHQVWEVDTHGTLKASLSQVWKVEKAPPAEPSKRLCQVWEVVTDAPPEGKLAEN